MSVQLAAGTDIVAFNAAHGTSTVQALPDGRTFLLALPPGETAAEAGAAWAGDLDLTDVEPNVPVQFLAAEQFYLAFDQFYLAFDGTAFPATAQAQWALSTIEAPAAQAISAGQGITVAVLDTGVDPTQPALASHLAPLGGYDYISDTTAITDVVGGLASGHGTFVAGLVAQVAPLATILPFRVLDQNGLGTVESVAAAIETAADEHVTVINLSMGMTMPSPILHEAIDYAQQQGAVVVASAGNEATSTPQYPAAWDGVVAVAGTDPQDQLAPFSNYGSWITVSAPAVDLYSTFPRGYARGSGTSFAAPLVSGELALLAASQPLLAAPDLVARLTGGSRALDALNPAYSGLLGAGRVDALRSLATPESQ